MSAAGESNGAGSFPHFPRLPPEVRLQIWQAALPVDLLPILHPYEEGHYRYFWTPRRNREHFDWIWSSDLLPNYIIQAPLLAVDSEARSTMLQWATRQRCKLRPRMSPTRPVYLRDFDVNYDAIYLPYGQVPALGWEYWSRTMQPPLVLADSSGSSSLRKLAIPEVAFISNQDIKSLCDTICTAQGSVDCLYILTSPPGELYWFEWRKHDPHQRWEFESLDAGCYRKLKDESGWTFVPGAVIADRDIHNSVMRMFEQDFLGRLSLCRAFEIKLVTARLRHA